MARACIQISAADLDSSGVCNPETGQVIARGRGKVGYGFVRFGLLSKGREQSGLGLLFQALAVLEAEGEVARMAGNRIVVADVAGPVRREGPPATLSAVSREMKKALPAKRA